MKEEKVRRKAAELMRELRNLPTPSLTRKEKYRSIRANVRQYMKGVKDL